MRQVFKLCGSTLVLLFVMLAGCAEDAGPATGEPTTSEPDTVVATETTGGIRGVVVDETIVPVGGADVLVAPGDVTTKADDNGNFVVSGLEEGTYFVTVSHPLHDTVQQNVDVVAGVANPEPVKFRLTRIITFDPYVDTIPMKGYISCSANVLLPLFGGVLSEECGEGTGYPCEAPDTIYSCNDRVGKNSENKAELPFYLSNNDPKTLIAEAVWKPSVTAGTGAQEGGFNMGIYVNFGCDPFCGWDSQIDRKDSMSPMYLRNDYEDPDGKDARYNGGDTPLADLGVTTETRFSTFTWAAADGTGVLLEQSFDVYVSASYGLPIRDDWSYVTDAENPFS